MSEKRGYPNPDYTEEDLQPVEMNALITLDDEEYRELIQKACCYDLLAGYIHRHNEVDEKVVRAITCTDGIEESEIQKYQRWWSEETSKNFALAEKNRELQEEIGKLKQQINDLLPCMDDEKSAEVSE